MTCGTWVYFSFVWAELQGKRTPREVGRGKAPVPAHTSLSSNHSFSCGENWQGIKAYKAMRFLTQSRRNEISILSLLFRQDEVIFWYNWKFQAFIKSCWFFIYFTCSSSHVFTKVCLIIECNTVLSCISLYIWFRKLSSLIFVHWPNKGPRNLTIVLPAPFIRLHPFLFNYLVSLYKISWPNKDSFISVFYVLPLVYLFVLMLIPTCLVYWTYRI